MKVVAIVGMSGSGKSEVARYFREKSFAIVRFGDVTDEELAKLGLELTEANERKVREALREKHGMAAYALLNLPRIDDALERSNVVVDGLYSWEEYLHLKTRYGDDLITIAVWSSPKTRHARLAGRRVRPLTPQESVGRDKTEIENLNKGGPIAVADYTVLNETTLNDMKEQLERIIENLR